MSHSHLPRLVVVLSPINLQLCNHYPPLPLPPMVSCCVFPLLRCLSSLLCGISSSCAITSCSASLRPLIRLVVALPTSCPAGCCIASHQAATSHQQAPLPLIAPLHLGMPLSVPLPLLPLVRLVVVSPLLTLPPPICQHLRLSLCCHLSLHHGLLCLLFGWLFHCLSSRRPLPSAGASASHCTIASHHAPLHAITSCTSSLVHLP
jgi:hypothetical protein